MYNLSRYIRAKQDHERNKRFVYHSTTFDRLIASSEVDMLKPVRLSISSARPMRKGRNATFPRTVRQTRSLLPPSPSNLSSPSIPTTQPPYSASQSKHQTIHRGLLPPQRPPLRGGITFGRDNGSSHSCRRPICSIDRSDFCISEGWQGTRIFG